MNIDGLFVTAKYYKEPGTKEITYSCYVKLPAKQIAVLFRFILRSAERNERSRLVRRWISPTDGHHALPRWNG
jgi:hypothetical protein